jgi:GT2 family glycosyltransferase
MSASPQASIVIPAYHSDATIADCLSSLRNQTFRDFETIVVNSSPGDRTGSIVTSGFPEVRYEESSTRLLPHAARNRGVAIARGSSLVFTDPDCIAAPDWLERLLSASAGGAVVQGSMGVHGNGWLMRGIHLCKWFQLLPGLSVRAPRSVSTGNACYPRAAFEAAGPFEGEFFCGDALLGWRASELGYGLRFEPGAVVGQIHRGTLRSFCRERFSRGREYAEVIARRGGWSRVHAAAMSAAAPLLLGLVIARAARAAWRSGWKAAFLATLPVQLAGQAAWCGGEAVARARLALRGVGR